MQRAKQVQVGPWKEGAQPAAGSKHVKRSLPSAIGM